MGQTLGYIQELRSPGDRARFVHAVHRVADAGDIDSLRLVALKSREFTADCDNPLCVGRVIGTRYIAELEGGHLAGREVEGQRFTVWVNFARLDRQGVEPVQLILQGLCVALRSSNRPHVTDVMRLDVTDYRYIPGIEGGEKIPMDNFPVEWRARLADHAMQVVLGGIRGHAAVCDS